jgi:hypothetical protein
VVAIGDALRFAFGMTWEVLWALILGFALSGAVDRRAEGKTWREALRCLKRHLVRAVFKLLKEISLSSRPDQLVIPSRPISAVALT